MTGHHLEYSSSGQQHGPNLMYLTNAVLLPLFYEKADSPAMIKHAMDILKMSHIIIIFESQ